MTVDDAIWHQESIARPSGNPGPIEGGFLCSTNFDSMLDTALLGELTWTPRVMKVHGKLDPLQQSIGELEDSNLSRLFRVVRDWVAEAEEQAEAELSRASLEEPVAIGDKFITLLAEGQHKLLEREAGKSSWDWFSQWQLLTLALAEEGPTLNGQEVLDLILGEMVARRLAPKPPRPCVRHARAERLVRLATSVIPNAPPRPVVAELMPIGAG